MSHFTRKLLSTIALIFSLLIQILLSILLTCLIGPIFLTFYLLNELIRLLVSILLYIRFRNKIQLSIGSDNMWHYEKCGNNRICFMVFLCTDPINVDNHRELFQTRVLNYITPEGHKPYDKLKKIFTKKFGYHCSREDENFDIKNHIKIYPGSEHNLVTESDLMNKILPELSADFDESKPQWEDVIIPRFTIKDDDKITCARILRYHHGIMDGASALMILATCMQDDEKAKPFPYPVDPLKPLKISRIVQLFTNLFCFLMGAWTMVKGLYVGSTIKSRYATEKFTGKRNYAFSEKIDVDQLRKIKTAMKVSVPTILSAATGAALRKLDKTHPSKNPEFRGKVAEQVTVGMVSAILPYPNVHPRNHFTITHFEIATGEMSWDQRIRLVNKEMLKLKWDPAVYLNYFMFKSFGRLPAPVFQHIMDSSGGSPISFSNIPAASNSVNLFGNEIRDTFGFPPLLTDTGLGIATIRYADHMRFCSVTDDACLSQEEIHFFHSQCVEEIRMMAEECSSKNVIINMDPRQNSLKKYLNNPD